MKNPHRRLFLGRSLGAAQVAAAAVLLPGAARALTTAPAAPSDVRALSFNHLHTSEHIALVYARGAQFVAPALTSLNHFLRDHYSGDVGVIDPELFNVLHQVRRVLGTEQPFDVISGYRSAHTNETLRTTRGGGVAKHSLHMDGKAIDVRLPGVALADLRDAAIELKLGGVGFYPRENFVHIDTGRVRTW
ncbi:YcbK family protein [Ottowia sp.]|uniref:YcbK family protein n=1 Tax=Ottowia sp. TaxID=1898956 RepID=UPI00393B2CE2